MGNEMSPPAVRGRGRRPRPFHLGVEEQHALERLRDTAPKPYLRERAAAILKLAEGFSAPEVARTGLLRHRRRDTVYSWLRRYQVEGVAGLTLRAGRGRKPAFSPSPSHGGQRSSGAPRRGAA